MAQGTKIAGVTVLLELYDEATQDFIPLGGQRGASLSRSAETIDVSDKTTGGWATSMMGLKSWSIDCDGFVTLGDEGLRLMHEAFDNRTPLHVEVQVGSMDKDAYGYKYSGDVVIVDFPEDFAYDNAVTYTLSLQGASPLEREDAEVTAP